MLARVLLAAASLLGVAFAQTNAKVAFTSVPAVVEAGETYNITWGGGNDTVCPSYSSHCERQEGTDHDINSLSP
jgi:hypothetical protein